MRVHHLNCGSMRPVGGKLVDGEPGLLRAGRMVCHCLLIESEAGLVLVDAGLGSQDLAKPAERLGRRFLRLTRPVLDETETAARQVIALGHAVEDVRHIVLTHLDVDHAGGIADFPNATVHVSEVELRAALNPSTVKERSRYRAPQWAHGPSWETYADAGEPWFGFEAVRELTGLPPEILMIPLAGHTRGHVAVAVDLGSRWLVHAGDAYFFRGEVDPDRTRTTPILGAFQSVVEHEHAARMANQRRLRELVRDHRGEVEVFSAHDAVELREFQASGTPTR